ncbi:hypothetical protein ACFONG_06650 [Uliginosibacterium paludis]|uniref:Uncharacterized protein n=1 Tax=Uliginosibacterium paludis TaxID=1615952 RepID=A0ABV2CLC5_9RHOO
MRIFDIAALGLMLPMLAQAQSPSNVSNRPAESASRSYKAFQDEPVGNWRALNDAVERIGGWKVYAREQLSAETPATSQDAKPANSGARQ